VGLREISHVLTARASNSGIELPDPLATRLTVYYQLLAHWNRRINLTSLSDSDEAVDRLLLEPIAAAARLPTQVSLVDLGSGGGSPAIPLALALQSPRLLMVESRTRKASFLREAIRELGLPATVETDRFEVVAMRPEYAGSFDLLSVRAVRLDPSVFAATAALLRAGGRAVLFRAVDAVELGELPMSLRRESTNSLLPSSRSALTLLTRA
jgi:16S rRNA (guanine527-N7)-methyltransferase